MEKIFKAEADGDTLYFGAETLEQAEGKLTETWGPIPESMVTWTEVDVLPEGEELL
jgi:hypothetical protein